MKNIFFLYIFSIFLIGCQNKVEQRYFADSAEIETLKYGIKAYESGDWDKWKSHFSDTAKIFVNAIKPVAVDVRLEELKAMAGAMSSYGFSPDREYIEMVLDKEDETWVYYWATHKNTFAHNNKELTIPVHLAVQFVDGKIVEEHVYFNETELIAELMTLRTALKDTLEAVD